MTRHFCQIFVPVLLVGSAHAAAPIPSFEALLIQPDGTTQRAYLVTATQASIRYRESKDAGEIKDRQLSELASVHVFEPREYSAAMDLFQARRYQEAKQSFAAIKDLYAPISTLKDNPGTLAAFYELECFRKLGDLGGLSEALKKFNKDPLVREHQHRQIEMDIFWDAVRTKDWTRLESLAKDRQKQRLPGYQRAQVSYCYALALEGLGKPTEALDAYDTALTADLGASAEIARNSALAILRIHLADPAVKSALKQGTAPADQVKLREAQAIARLYQLSLGAGEPLPAEYQVFLKE